MLGVEGDWPEIPPAQDTAPHPGSYLSSVQVLPEHVACAPRARLTWRQEEKLIGSPEAGLPGTLSCLQVEGSGEEGDSASRTVSSVVEQGRGRKGRGCGRKERHRGQKQRQPFVLAAHRSKFYCKYRSCFFPKGRHWGGRG